jgi:flagellar hook protein FlgE
MIDFSDPLAGMNRAEARLNQTAARLAKTGFSGDEVDLSAEMVAMLEARNEFAANTKVAQTEYQMNKSLIDLLA